MTKYEETEEKYKDLEALPEALPESVNTEDHVIASWYIGLPPGFDMNEVAQLGAIEQSTGTGTCPGETPEVRKKHVAKVIGVYEGPMTQ